MTQMNRIIIYFAALTLLLVNSCNKPIDTTILEQFDRYIFFSHDVATKATLLDSNTGLAGFKYGVIGFKYSGTWDAFKTDNDNAKPNVFYGNNNALTNVEEITCDANGYGTYAPLQGWSNNLRYTFFAYYPIDNVTLFSRIDGTYSRYEGGSPYICYSLDNSSNDALKASMVDLMTGQSTNKDLTPTDDKVINGNVSFEFNHRLSSIGVKARNSTSGNITIKQISLSLTGIQYGTIIIPLEGGETIRQAPISGAFNATLPVAIPEAGVSVTSTESELSDKLILIPQAELQIALTVNYDRAVNGYDTINCENTVNLTIAQLLEGKKYLIPLNFKESTVELGGTAEEGAWGDNIDVPSTFN